MALGSSGALTGIALMATVAISVGLVIYKGRRVEKDETDGTPPGDRADLACQIVKYLFLAYFVVFVLKKTDVWFTTEQRWSCG